MDYPYYSPGLSDQDQFDALTLFPEITNDITTTTSSSSAASLTSSVSAPTIRYFAPSPDSIPAYQSPYTRGDDLPRRSKPSKKQLLGTLPDFVHPRIVRATSTYSSSSRGSSTCRTVESRQEDRTITHGAMASRPSAGTRMSTADREQMLRSLRTHRVNTLSELRRIEKSLADNGSSGNSSSSNANNIDRASAEVTEAMTTAWAHYVNSNNLLSELRGLSKNYPFSSECLDEAKWQVIGDPGSTKSWNYAWLILTKIKQQNLVQKHARLLAAKPVMWGGRSPSPSAVDKLAQACVAEWTRALDLMLRQWSSPPSVSSNASDNGL